MVEGYFDRLPCELLQNIALMLPFNSIIQLRYSSKFWYNLLTDPKFIDLHLSRALEKPHGYLLNALPRLRSENECYFAEQSSGGQLSISKIFEYSFGCYEKEIWARFQSSGGLMCAYSSQSCCFRIFNPHIAEEILIPRDSKLTRWLFQCFIFGYSPSIKEYKILKVGDLQKFCSLNVAEVCTLGSNIWREIQSVPDNLLFLDLDQHTQCQGNPFWMDESNLHLYFFDFVSEKFHVIPGPLVFDLVRWTRGSDPCYLQNSLISMGDTVGYVLNDKLWVLEDKTKGIWIKRYHFSIPPFCDDVELIGTLENGHLFGIMNSPTKVFVHDMGCTGFTVKGIKLDEDEDGDGVEEVSSIIEYMTPHVRSFVSPIRIMRMENFSHKRKWILDTLKLDCDATDYDLVNKMYEFLQAYEKVDKDEDSKSSHQGRP